MTGQTTLLAPETGGRRRSARAAVLRAEARLYRRDPTNLLAIALPPALLLVLGQVPMFREAEADLGGLRVIDLYVPVVVLIALVTAGLQVLPPTLTGYRELGVLRRMSTTPVRPATLLSAQMALNGAAALLSALLSLAVGRWALDVALPREAAGYALVLLLAAVACLALGAVVAALARTAKHASGIGTAVYFPALFCTGLWIPVRSMPDVLADVVAYTPFGAAAEALDRAAAGGWPAWSQLAVLVGWGVVASAAAVRWFRWE
ncbi:ABC transporter permease [Streptomyces sp. DSM 44915]|uniref:ABC transporter permease n=1 Tax=Streptomyces chisholmiae TaxID=3075540 RepID=A0ABU2JY70_9ACTN|nr:ABC transporter permease [Streptomyces sp. DSM 44915]MDT0269897.1 ABC transporter permease [Streptomyces sp. DSM 44915]